MIKITNKEIGILEFVFGLIFLILTIGVIVFTINQAERQANNYLNAVFLSSLDKNNISYYYNTEQGSFYTPGQSNGLYLHINDSTMNVENARALKGDITSQHTSAIVTIYTSLPIFILCALGALAISFIMIFQGIYHWNQE